MNKTFKEFLEQRYPELYNEMLNEVDLKGLYEKGKGFLKTVGGAATAAAGTVLTGAALAAALASGGGEVKAHAFEFVFELQYQALGGFFANPRNAHEA